MKYRALPQHVKARVTGSRRCTRREAQTVAVCHIAEQDLNILMVLNKVDHHKRTLMG